MKFELRSAKNGWILEYCDPENNEEIVGVEAEDEHDAFVEFLRTIAGHYGPSDSKHSPKRIHVLTLPGIDYTGPVSAEQKEHLQWIRHLIDHALEAETSKAI